MSLIEFHAAASAAETEATAAARAAEEPVVFRVSDKSGDFVEDFDLYLPDESILAIFMAEIGNSAMDARTFPVTTKFLEQIFTPESYADLRDMIVDPNHWITIHDIPGMIEKIIQAAGQRPTKPSSGSTTSRRTGGRPLTDHLPPAGSTRSPSARRVSATRSTGTSSAAPTTSKQKPSS